MIFNSRWWTYWYPNMIPSEYKWVCKHSDTHVTVKACEPLDRFSIASFEFQILYLHLVSMKTVSTKTFSPNSMMRIFLSHIKLQNIYVYRMSKNAFNNCWVLCYLITNKHWNSFSVSAQVTEQHTQHKLQTQVTVSSGNWS